MDYYAAVSRVKKFAGLHEILKEHPLLRNYQARRQVHQAPGGLKHDP
jgi:hypothetical protein